MARTLATAELAKASVAGTGPLGERELALDLAARKGSACGFIALPLLGVGRRPRPEAELVIGAAAVGLAHPPLAAHIGVLVLRVVSAGVEGLAGVALIPSDVAS